jgi:hypothetical protein
MSFVSKWLLSFGKDVWIVWCTKSTITSDKIKEVKDPEEIKNPGYTCRDRFSFCLSHDTVTASQLLVIRRAATKTNWNRLERYSPHIYV